jgi:hypothetical protein
MLALSTITSGNPPGQSAGLALRNYWPLTWAICRVGSTQLLAAHRGNLQGWLYATIGLSPGQSAGLALRNYWPLTWAICRADPMYLWLPIWADCSWLYVTSGHPPEQNVAGSM